MTTTQALSAGKFSLRLGPFPVTANYPLRSTWTPSELISLISQDRASCRICPSSLIFDLQPPFGVSGFSTPWQLAWIPLPWTPWMLDPESPWGPRTAFSFKLLILGMCACNECPAFPAQAETLIYCPEARVHTHTLCPSGTACEGSPWAGLLSAPEKLDKDKGCDIQRTFPGASQREAMRGQVQPNTNEDSGNSQVA